MKKKPRNILVPTDFSPASEAAKEYASVLAETLGATLHILHVIPDPLAMGWGVDAAYLPQLLERTELQVKERLEATRPSGGDQPVQSTVAVDTGAPVDSIVDYAQKHDIDLIVMGTQGRGTVERMWVGSVTQGVLRRAPCPVVSVQQPRS